MWILKCPGFIIENRVWIWFFLFDIKKNSWSIWTVFFIMTIVIHRWQLCCWGPASVLVTVSSWVSWRSLHYGTGVWKSRLHSAFLFTRSFNIWLLSLAWVPVLGSHRIGMHAPPWNRIVSSGPEDKSSRMAQDTLSTTIHQNKTSIITEQNPQVNIEKKMVNRGSNSKVYLNIYKWL